MSKHKKQDDEDKYSGNGYDPTRPIPSEDPGGEHGNDDEDDEGQGEEQE